MWEAIRRLESSGLKVLCITADGAGTNRKLFCMHYNPKECTSSYKTKNSYSSDDRWLYFVADPPHLVKTIRNCWSHSGTNGSRLMQVCNSCISEWFNCNLYAAVLVGEWKVYYMEAIMGFI